MIVVKSKNDKDNSEMKNVIKKIISPSKDPVKYMRETKSGKIVIQCRDHTVVNSVKEKLNKNMGEKYTADKPVEYKPTVTIINVCDFDDDQSLIERIRTQNDTVVTHESVIEIIDVKKRNNTHTVVIRTDTETFNRIRVKFLRW